MNPADIKPHYNLDILNAIPMGSVVEKFDELKRKGAHCVTKCPWHNDEHPSLTIYESTTENHCHCFACGKGGGPISYVIEKAGLPFLDACAWLAREFGCGVDRGEAPVVDTKYCSQSIVKKPVMGTDYTYIPMHIVDEMVSCESSFVKCLMQIYDPHRVQHVVEEYKLGCYESECYYDDVVFPSIDEKGRVHNLKVQHYCTDIDSPDFLHSDKSHCLWIGKELIKRGILPSGSTFDNDCMFGAHLLSRYPAHPVILVESPKNAIIGSLYCYDCVWVATGCKGMLKESVLSCLKGRNVIVYPDRDAIADWKAKLGTARMQALANFTVSNFCENAAPEGKDKYDVADFVIDKCLQQM